MPASFFNKAAGLRSAALLSEILTQVFFLWILWNIWEYLFHRTPRWLLLLFWKLYVIHWKIPAPDSLLNEVVDLQPASLLLRKWLRHWRFPVNLQSFSEELFCNTSARLLLSMNMWASDFKQLSCGSRYSRMCQVKFAWDSLEKVWSDLVCWGRPCEFKFFKSCLPQYLLGIFLNTLTHVYGGNKFRFLFGQIS